MTRRLASGAVALWLATVVVSQGALAVEIAFRRAQADPVGRIDAIAHLGKGVVVAGSRGQNDRGHVLVSRDCGVTWRMIGNVTGTDFITCLQSGGDGLGYLLTGRNVHVWKTTDFGETWADLGRVSSAANGAGAANAYGLAVTGRGTVLVADADGPGGHIHRSTDHGNSWQDLGRVSPRPLYRLNAVRDGLVVNGWAGHVSKSIDDGLTWTDMGELSPSPLYAVETIGSDGTVLMGAENGEVFRSRDDGRTWHSVGRVGDAADDFAWLGQGRVLYSTYTGSRGLYLSEDAGASWIGRGPLAAEPDDWLDHFICFEEQGSRHLVGGTNKGLILYARLPR